MRLNFDPWAVAIVLAGLACGGCACAKSTPVADDERDDGRDDGARFAAFQVDVGTFEGRQAGTSNPVLWSWKSVTHPTSKTEVWATLARMPVGGFNCDGAYPYRQMNYGLAPIPDLGLQRVDVVEDAEGHPIPLNWTWGESDDPAAFTDRIVFLNWVVDQIRTDPRGVPPCTASGAMLTDLDVFVAKVGSGGGNSSPAVGLFAPGYYTISENGAAVAWVWHPSSSTGREYWCMSNGFRRASTDHAPTYSVTGQPANADDTLANFKAWVHEGNCYTSLDHRLFVD